MPITTAAARRQDILALVLILAAALLLRVILARHEGYVGDIRLFGWWAEKGARYGIGSIYDPRISAVVPDYPPAILYLYTAAGEIMHWLTGGYYHSWIFRTLLKGPAIAADLIASAGVYVLVRRSSSERIALLGAAIVAFSPAVWFESAFWGQTDSIYTLAIGACIVSIGLRRFGLAGVFAGLAVGSKFQSLAFLPLLFVALMFDWRRLPKFVLGMTGTLIALLAPFIAHGTLPQVLNAYARAIGSYNVVSVNALGIWTVAFPTTGLYQVDTDVLWGVSYRTIGLILFGVASALILKRLYDSLRRLQADPHAAGARIAAVLTAAALITIAFFTLPTEIHERYFFPFVLFAIPWALVNRSNLILYFSITFLFFINLVLVYLGEPNDLYQFDEPAWMEGPLAAVFIVFAVLTARRMLRALAEFTVPDTVPGRVEAASDPLPVLPPEKNSAPA